MKLQSFPERGVARDDLSPVHASRFRKRAVIAYLVEGALVSSSASFTADRTTSRH